MVDANVDSRRFVLTRLYYMKKSGFGKHKGLDRYVSSYRELTNGRNPFLENKGRAYATAHFIGFVFGTFYDELPIGYKLGNEDMETVRQGMELAKPQRATVHYLEDGRFLLVTRPKK